MLKILMMFECKPGYLHSKNAGSSTLGFFHIRAHKVTLYIFLRRHFANVNIGIGFHVLIFPVCTTNTICFFFRCHCFYVLLSPPKISMLWLLLDFNAFVKTKKTYYKIKISITSCVILRMHSRLFKSNASLRWKRT